MLAHLKQKTWGLKQPPHGAIGRTAGVSRCVGLCGVSWGSHRAIPEHRCPLLCTREWGAWGTDDPCGASCCTGQTGEMGETATRYWEIIRKLYLLGRPCLGDGKCA